MQLWNLLGVGLKFWYGVILRLYWYVLHTKTVKFWYGMILCVYVLDI